MQDFLLRYIECEFLHIFSPPFAQPATAGLYRYTRHGAGFTLEWQQQAPPAPQRCPQSTCELCVYIQRAFLAGAFPLRPLCKPPRFRATSPYTLSYSRHFHPLSRWPGRLLRPGHVLDILNCIYFSFSLREPQALQRLGFSFFAG
nr:MAG TPA: hypothetical protein [Caudoviricetes sp.]